MDIDTWKRPDYARVLREREEDIQRSLERRKQQEEALEWERQQKAAKKREELWADYSRMPC